MIRLPDAASWMVDPARFRVFLDKLHDSLANVPLFTPSATWFPTVTDGSHLVNLIEQIASSVRTHTPKVARYFAAQRLGSPRDEEVAPLRELLHDLDVAWKRRFLLRIGPAKALAIRDILAHPVPDILTLLNKGRMENAYSDVIAWLLDPEAAPSIAPSCLLALASRVDDGGLLREAVRRSLAQRAVGVHRELVIGRDWDGTDALDRIDIVVSATEFIIVVENKLNAREHGDQTRRYWGWLERQPVAKGAFFLTPYGAHASCPEFSAISYVDFLSCVLEAPARGEMTPEEELILAMYTKVLSAHALKSELRTLVETI